MLEFYENLLGDFMTKVLLFYFAVIALPVNAALFGNGDFSSGSSNWNDASGNGSVSFGAGQAMLQTGNGDDLFSAVLVQGDDGSFWFPQTVDPFTLDANANWLLFDARFEDLGIDATESALGIFSDALFVALYDYLDPGLDLILDPFIDISLDGLGFISYALNVASLQGRDIALSFELLDADDGRNSKITLDNVRFAEMLPVTPIPTPSVLVLVFLMMPFLYQYGFKVKEA